MMSREAQTFNPKRILIIKNRSATNYKRAQKYIAQLRSALPKCAVEIVDVTGTKSETSHSRIDKALRAASATTLVAVAGGDGTLSSVINVLCVSSKLTAHNRKAVVLPLWGGNANDLAVMLNGSPPRTVEPIVTKGSVLSVHPLSVHLHSKDGQIIVRAAACYVSFGASAQILKHMEHSSHDRNRKTLKRPMIRLIAEVSDIAKAVFRLKPLNVRTEKQRTNTMYDRVFINGPRFAKVLRSPAHLDQPEYFEIVAHQKGWRYVTDLFRSLLRSGSGSMQHDSKRFIIHNPTVAQIDGEVVAVPSQTQVEVSIHVHSCQLLRLTEDH